jgi:tetratricopeptide (TPR) repeat protein
VKAIMTNYQADLKRIEDDIHAILRAHANATADLTPDSASPSRLYFRHFQLASLTGDLTLLPALDAALDTAIPSSPQPADLWLIKAHIALRRHRFTAAEAALHADPSFTHSPNALLLYSDIDLQLGHYSAARTLIESVIARDATWDAIARLAYLNGVMGELTTADDLYAQAEDELTAKQMQTYAWLELQRGALHFQRGDHTTARRHYNRADTAYTGYWLTAERIAELDGAQGNFAAAITSYQHLHAASPRPEWKHALADLHALSGDLPSAHLWQQLAHAQYRGSVLAGEVYHLHYLVDLCCELPGHAHEAVSWAREDLALRDNFMTQGDLAWALYRSASASHFNNTPTLEEAVALIDRALASGAISSRLYFQAACIYAATGHTDRSTQCTRALKQTNPHPARATVSAPQIRIQPWSQAPVVG